MRLLPTRVRYPHIDLTGEHALTTQQLEVVQVVDSCPVSPLQKLVVGLCACIAFLDGFDAQAIGYVAPAIIKAWQVPRGQMGPVFSAGLIGLMLGALLIAPLADRFGRRPVILISTLVFGLFSLFTATAASLHELWALRFLTGIGLGGCMPNIIALTSEYSPQRRRSLMVMVMFAGFTLGSLFAGLISAKLIVQHGWQSVFVVGGVLPLLALPIIYFQLPESIGFLALRPGNWPKATKLLGKIDASISAQDARTFVVSSQPVVRASVAALFRDTHTRNTLLLWVIFFMSLLDIYLLVSWLPTAMNSGGASVQTAIFVGIMLQFGGLFGPLPLGWLLDRSGARLTMSLAYFLAALCIACIGVFAGFSIPLTLLAVFGAGFGVIGGQTAANAVAAMTYPTAIRSTGVGWALGVGRIGSIVGPVLAGILIGQNISIANLFLLSAVPALLAAAAVLALAPPAQLAGK
jgi:AAHS family 4-hydroxybenzoate transporter-like MFS transporter